VELGSIEIITEVSILSIHLCFPREGRLEAVFHVCAYMGLHHNTRVVYDPTYPSVDMGTLIETDLKSMYGDVKDMIPSDAPVTHGKDVDLHLFIDYDHAGDKCTMRSRTGFVKYLNMAPIVWFSRQPTSESSVSGSEFFAMNNGIETCCGLRYKLIMMGVTLSGPTYIYGENMSVVHNTQRTESVLKKKKSNSILYHAVCESDAIVEYITGYVPSVDNPADIFTKVVPGGQKRNHLIHLLLHDLCD
jgi:hypothetical protein